MIEITLFGRIVGTLGSGLSVVLAIVALSSVTYLSMTLITAARRLPAAPSAWARMGTGSYAVARLLGLGASVATLGLALLGMRVGSLGSGGELVPTLLLALGLACAAGGSTACAFLGGARGLAVLADAAERRGRELAAAERERRHLLEAKRRSFIEGADLRAEVADSEAQLARLRAAVDALRAARDGLAEKARAEAEPADDAGPARPPDLRREIAEAEAEVAAKVALGERVLAAAEAATFRLACSEPWRRLLRRRPRDAMQALATVDSAGAVAADRLRDAGAAIEAFLVEVRGGRAVLDALEARRSEAATPEQDAPPADASDPLARAKRELDALASAYGAVLSRIEVVALQLAARSGMAEVKVAAGAVSDKARAAGAPEAELLELVQEVARAEALIGAGPADEAEERALSDALARGAAALGRGDTASLDELVAALREIG